MRKLLPFLLLCLPTVVLSQVALNQVDDFEDYTMGNWTKNSSIPNENIYNGGPLGDDDNFLRVTSSGSGTDLELMTKNTAQWQGNYYQGNLSSRVKYISMDVRNSGSNVIFLRLSFQTDYGLIYRCSTTNAIAVLPNEGWKRISFSILEENITALSDTFSYAVTFGSGSQGVEEMRILHNAVPSWESEPIDAILDIDNIMAEDQTLSTPTFEIKPELKLFPNPTSDAITVTSNENVTEDITYGIIDLLGRTVKQGRSKLNQEINIQDLNSGNYIVEIKNANGGIFREKLIKN
ncbi:T9SS type A sorting domain-containing protein [Winogradskyella psychrotolerans]|uniref:T9SS type A sorting domain-containing protein n=1 Tax=Winogradskyella psychrotolerans TaxID=1344585 RepID=UPI001C06E18A|nr:T9SS type A sorting domain-containing protein [Winogradskyella psychrotolerans]MBU2920888.1 T9SS type A sorting domain-containing protein [Winogradskyella psychrotolerans]